MEQDIKAAARLIKEADGLLIGAGAGMGVDSGLPDFRGNEGFWKAYPLLGKARIPFVEIANPASFSDNPLLAWGFYGHRLRLYRDTIPHQGFHILQAFAGKMAHGAFVFTSNVDGQFQKAGFPPERVAECHGSIHYLQCAHPCSRAIWSADTLNVAVDEDSCRWLPTLPSCTECGNLARPNILLFNDWGWISDQTDLQMERLNKWYMRLDNPLVIELGAGLAVPTVRRVCESIPAPLVRINPTDPQIDSNKRNTISLKMRGLEALEHLHAAWQALS
ncbi:MAG: NAD-dependent deacetylase [Burkholderiaceae bacterium]|jgi:NAD-dependent SIR2 family protein deacetylase|nr:NAD-dependent deacetylase [Burkholderiaceae bacterium]